jgi:autophagy-related protein 5
LSPIPYLIQVPRLSYLPLLLPRLTLFFGPASSFSYEGILLKNLPVGLLCDLYQPTLPWRLVLGDGPLFDIHDTFINSVKEVCPCRPVVRKALPDIICPRQTSSEMVQPRA